MTADQRNYDAQVDARARQMLEQVRQIVLERAAAGIVHLTFVGFIGKEVRFAAVFVVAHLVIYAGYPFGQASVLS